jgi:hypothetical protein
VSKLNKSSILIVGLARNCEKYLFSNISLLERAFSDAKKLDFLIIESDSDDKTLDTLETISKNSNNFRYVSLGNLRLKYPKRTDRIAQCRNHYLSLISNDNNYFEVDYVVVADLDGVNCKLTADAVNSCWIRDDWDVCTANQAGPYYDIWALRHHLWSPNDCWDQSDFMQRLGVGYFRSVVASGYSRMIRIPSSAEWIKVESAFGGIAIYRKNIIISSRYVGLTYGGAEICEHVALNLMINSFGGRIYINPKFINSGIVEHAFNATFFGFIVLFVKMLGSTLFYKLIRYIK